jgi:uncharacterized repeat protein (TIGR01451 family)
MKRNYILLTILVTILLVLAGCTEEGIFSKFYGRAIHTYTPPSTPELADFPEQFLVDDDVNYILSFEDAIVADSSYDLSTLDASLEADMCAIVTGAGYDCVDENSNVLSTPTGSFFSNFITGGAIIDNYPDAVRLVSCARYYKGVTDYRTFLNSCAEGWDYQGILGLIYTVQKPNTVPVYACYRAIRTDAVKVETGKYSYYDHFLSTDVGCEGTGLTDGRIGYVYTTAQADTIPTYRCWESPDDIRHGRWNHFMTNEPTCSLNNQNWQLEATWHLVNYCNDPDGGKNISAATTVEGLTDSKADSCLGATKVNEIFCQAYPGEGISEQPIDCPSGEFCVNGACEEKIDFSVDKTIEWYNLSNQQVMFRVTVTNTGSPTSNVIIRDVVPQGMTIDSTSKAYTADAGALRWDIVSFDNNNDDTSDYNIGASTYDSEGIFIIDIIVTISSSVTGGTNLTNYVNLTTLGGFFEDTASITVGTTPPAPPTAPTGGVIDDYTDVARLQRCMHIHKGVRDDLLVAGNCPSGWDSGGTLGLIYTAQKPNTVAIYSCYRRTETDRVQAVTGDHQYDDHFTSTDTACEGQRISGLIGYVYSTPQTDTVPIHRCWRQPEDMEHGVWNHFMTNEANCAFDNVYGTLEATWHAINPCSDPDGQDPYTAAITKGVTDSVVDECVDSDTVKEYYCELPKNKGYTSKNMDCAGGSACINGVCTGGTPFADIGIIEQTEANDAYGNLNRIADPVCPFGTQTIGGVTEFHWKDNQYGRKFNVCMSPPHQTGVIKTCSINSDSSEGPWAYACNPGACPTGTTALDGLIKTGMYFHPSGGGFTFANRYSRVCLPAIVGGKVLTHHAVSSYILDPVLVDGDSYSFPSPFVESAPAMNCPADMVEVTGLVTNPVLELEYLKNNDRNRYYEFVYNKICVAVVNSCQNTIIDGSETDVDCGGSDCDECSVGEACVVDADCETDNCDSGFCAVSAPAPFCGDGLLQTGEQCDPGTPGFPCANATDICSSTTCQCIPPSAITSYQISIPDPIVPSSLSSNEFSNDNTVLIGTCADNGHVANALGTAECAALTTGRALILMQHNPYRLIVAADASIGVLIAVNVLNNAANYNLHGPRVDIAYIGTNFTLSFPHCFDSTQNYDETGVDCGGSVCAACPPPSYPGATPGSPGAGGGGGGGGSWYTQPVAEQETTECMDDWICDLWSDCSASGIQTRVCHLNDYEECTLIMAKPPETQSCTAPYVAPVESCFDGLLNQGEEGIDCGGPCAACPKEKPLWLVPVIIILLCTAIALGFLVYYIKFLKKPNVVSPLKKYVREVKSKGFKEPRIRQRLRKQGWAKPEIDKAMK